MARIKNREILTIGIICSIILIVIFCIIDRGYYTKVEKVSETVTPKTSFQIHGMGMYYVNGTIAVEKRTKVHFNPKIESTVAYVIVISNTTSGNGVNTSCVTHQNMDGGLLEETKCISSYF